jgi:hypothetical protein
VGCLSHIGIDFALSVLAIFANSAVFLSVEDSLKCILRIRRDSSSLPAKPVNELNNGSQEILDK